MKRCIFLTGSPDADSLDWSNSLLSEFQTPLRRHLGLLEPELSAPEPAPSLALPKWRAITLDAKEDDHAGPPENSFPNHSEGQADSPTDRVGFLEYSLALIEGLDPSQVGASLETAGDGSTLLSTASFSTSLDSTALASFSPSSADSNQQADNTTPLLHFSGTITDLRGIPTAQHLLRIQPQTPTVNLVASIIAVAPARTVRLRKRNSEMDIIEVTVGDETRAGFAISFWVVPQESQQKPRDDMREALSRLRNGNVVLFQNLALSEFRGNVYGQSLSKRFARNSSSVAVLDRSRGWEDVVQSVGAQFGNKVKRVRAWADAFVGLPPTSTLYDRDDAHVGEELPPDTQ